MLVLLQGRNGACHNSCEVKRRKAHPPQSGEVSVDHPSEFIQHKHVERQVHPVGMHKGVGDDAVPFVVLMATVRDEHPG